MRSVRSELFAIGALLLLIGIFFVRLFYPQPNLIVTPDYGRSDAWHFSFSTKYALSESLQSNTLPLWRNDIGDGFPLLAEGQTGTFFLPNLLLFRFFPPVTAYNLALVFLFVTFAGGVYWLSRTLMLSPRASWFVAVSLTFSGLMITQLSHITLLQGMSMLPIIVTLSILAVQKGPFPWVGWLSFALSQQIGAGFPQATFLTLILATSFVLSHAYSRHRWQESIYWLVGIGLGTMGGAMQILPSWEYLRASTDPQGFTPATATMYSLPLKHLMSFFSPFSLGNPKLGTYPPFYAFDGSIFWENTAYIGSIPILLLIASLFFIRTEKIIVFLWSIAFASLVLAGGKYAPTYVLFSMFPLTLFRVPSRFLWIAVVALTLIGGKTTDVLCTRTRWRGRHALITLTLLFHSVQLLSTWWSYHLIEPAGIWTEKPNVASRLTGGRIITLGDSTVYNDIMTQTGWENPEPYRLLRQGLSPDSNMLWGISQHNVYAGRYLYRPSVTNSLLSDSIITDEQIATISATRFLNLFSVRYVLSFLPVNAPLLTPIGEEKYDNFQPGIYENPTALPRAYLRYEATTAATLTEAISIFADPTLIPDRAVLLETHQISHESMINEFLIPSTTMPPAQPDRIIWQEDTHVRIRLEVDAPNNALLVLTDTYYPGWQARIDGEKVPILAANLSQRAIVIPKGTHAVTFSYEPVSLRQGMLLSAISLTLTGLLMAALKLSEAPHIRKTTRRRVADPRHTRRR